MEAYKNIRIFKIKESSPEETDDLVAVEKRLRISFNGENLINIYCTPLMIRELVVGIIHNEGLLSGDWCEERINIEYGEEIHADIPSSGTVYKGESTVTSGCAGGLSFSRQLPERKILDNTVFNIETVRAMYSEFQKKSEVFRLTGGVHSAALADGNKMIVFSEDIGRHNAADKVIGYLILEKIPFQGKMMLTSGRLSSDIVMKCYKCGIPLLVSRSAPTSNAVEIAESAGITLVGFMRGKRMNVYTVKHRIVL